MIFLYDGSDPLAEIKNEMGEEVGILFTDRIRNWPDKAPDVRFAVDNRAYVGFNDSQFRGILARLESHKRNCIFVAVPDVVGSARRTLEIFRHYQLPDWPLALVAQDGIEDLEIPWGEMQAVFIGGTDKFKLSDIAVQVIKAAKILGKWVHVGRITGPERWDKFDNLGVDSCDGTGLSRFTGKRIRIGNRHPLFNVSEEVELGQ